MAGAPPPLPSTRPKGAYVPPPIPSNRPKVAYVHPLPPSTPEPAQDDTDIKSMKQGGVINTNTNTTSYGNGGTAPGSSSLGRQLQAALQDRMMNNLNQMSDKPNQGTIGGNPQGGSIKPPPAQKPHIASKPTAHTAPTSQHQQISSTPARPLSFSDIFMRNTAPQQQPQQQPKPTTNLQQPSSQSSSFSQLSSMFGSSSSSQSAGSNVAVTATADQKKAAANYSWNVTKDVSKNVSAKDVFQAGTLLSSAYSNNGKVNASKEQQAAVGRISSQVGQSAAKNVTAEEVGHAANFASTNAMNNLSVKGQGSNDFDFLAQVMGSKGGGVSGAQPTARARPKPGQPNLAAGLPPPPASTPRQQSPVPPQTQSGQLVPPRAAPRAPPGKSKTASGGGSALIDFDAFSDSAKTGPPGLPKSKAQGPGGARTKPTIIRPGAGRSGSPAVEQQQKKSKPPPRPTGPPSKKAAPNRPNAVHSTRSAGSTPPRPSGLQPKRKAPPRPGSQKGKKQAPGAPRSGHGKKENLPPRPGPGHPLFNKYMGSEPHGIASFDYQGQESDELSFKKDDVIILVKRIDGDWLEGKCRNRKGIFPTQFINIVKDINENTRDDYDGPQAVALFGFQASAADELAFNEGDTIKLLEAIGTVWFRGEINGKTGIFPSNHVEVIVPLPSASPMMNSVSGPHCVAKFEYNNDNPDDLKFAEGATIRLTARVGDEWYKGETGGRSGIFPAAFVDIIEDLPPAGASLGRLTPTTGNDVRAQYDFEGADNTELTFKEGDKITVTAQVGSDWLEGELNGKKGRFPANFVDRIPPGLPQAKELATVGVEPHCVVSFDFDAQGDDEMSLKTGERVTLLERIGDDWFRGKIGSREGIFPNTFVDVVIDLPSAGATPSTAKARFDFAAEEADELSFRAGDVITITERVNDEWLQGTIHGKSGRFPSAFVELAS